MSSDAAAYGTAETREKILRATWELLEAGGSISMVDAAARAGVSRQAIYLHFGDRAGLLVALVDFIDFSLGAVDLRARLYDAPTGIEALHRYIETMSWYTARIDRVTEVLEGGKRTDPALAAAWRNRMDRRREHLHAILGRIRTEGHLAGGWSVDEAVALVHAITMPAPWRELMREIGWTAEQYTANVTRLVGRSILAADSPEPG
ncbi:MAG: TetR/AcrR family transcriptional regulator [Candidatus Limnocylindria bacterium]